MSKLDWNTTLQIIANAKDSIKVFCKLNDAIIKDYINIYFIYLN